MKSRKPSESFNEWFKRLRAESEETQEKWADVMQTSQKQIHRWENSGEPSINQFKLLAAHLKLDLLTVMGEKPGPVILPEREESESDLRIACIRLILGAKSQNLVTLRDILSRPLETSADNAQGGTSG